MWGNSGKNVIYTDFISQLFIFTDYNIMIMIIIFFHIFQTNSKGSFVLSSKARIDFIVVNSHPTSFSKGDRGRQVFK